MKKKLQYTWNASGNGWKTAHVPACSVDRPRCGLLTELWSASRVPLTKPKGRLDYLLSQVIGWSNSYSEASEMKWTQSSKTRHMRLAFRVMPRLRFFFHARVQESSQAREANIICIFITSQTSVINKTKRLARLTELTVTHSSAVSRQLAVRSPILG